MFLSSLYLENKTVYERRLIFILKNYSIIFLSTSYLVGSILLIFPLENIFLSLLLVVIITLLSSTIFSPNQLENLTIYATLNLFRDIAGDITPPLFVDQHDRRYLSTTWFTPRIRRLIAEFRLALPTRDSVP